MTKKYEVGDRVLFKAKYSWTGPDYLTGTIEAVEYQGHMAIKVDDPKYVSTRVHRGSTEIEPYVEPQPVFDAKALADEFRVNALRQREIRDTMAREGYQLQSDGSPVKVLAAPKKYTFVRTVQEKV